MHLKSESDSRTRRDRLIREHVHDPYQTPSKLPEPTICPICCAVFQDGRWQWTTLQPTGANRHTCQACRRIRDGYPAGSVKLTGGFVGEHSQELVRLARNNESLEKRDHPMNRIITIEEQPNLILITTTDIHLPRRIAEAIRNAYKGDLELRYDEEGYFTRAEWHRES
ncbi:MAG TPA: BCAM0308 family protein [Terrimicrobiaceae bacterium]